MRRLGLSTALVLALSLLAAAPAAAAKPEHYHEPFLPLVIAGVCDFDVELDNSVDRGKTSLFAPGPDDSQRMLIRGYFDATITNVDTDATYPSRGGATIKYVFYPDGSFRVDGMGTSFVAWYFEGDDVNVEPGVYEMNGHVTEWYAADGSFIRAVVRGKATNMCEVLA